jgi:hypothetical protein
MGEGEQTDMGAAVFRGDSGVLPFAKRVLASLMED